MLTTVYFSLIFIKGPECKFLEAETQLRFPVHHLNNAYFKPIFDHFSLFSSIFDINNHNWADSDIIIDFITKFLILSAKSDQIFDKNWILI